MSILKSILLTTIVSLLFAFGLRNVIGFWETFTLAFAIQFVAAFIYSSFKISNEDTIVNTFQAELDELIDMSKVTIDCPCGKNRFVDVVFVGVDNVFDCDKCGSNFKVIVDITPTLTTEPVDNITKTFDTLVKEKEL